MNICKGLAVAFLVCLVSLPGSGCGKKDKNESCRKITVSNAVCLSTSCGKCRAQTGGENCFAIICDSANAITTCRYDGVSGGPCVAFLDFVLPTKEAPTACQKCKVFRCSKVVDDTCDACACPDKGFFKLDDWPT